MAREPLARVYQEFQQKLKIDTGRVDYSTHCGKGLRRELLVELKDQAGLRYREIAELPEFFEVKMNSLGKMYKDGKRRIRPKLQKVKH